MSRDPGTNRKDPRFRNHARLTVYIAKDIDKAIRSEARKRKVTISALVEEAFQGRALAVFRTGTP